MRPPPGTCRLSCAFPPSRDLADLARRAEALGYARVWIYDSPALYGDAWIAAARVAEATTGIGVGIGVAVPSLRHPMVTAAAISDLELAAPGRLVVAFGTGYTARVAMGRRPMRWSELATYVDQVRRLLRGEVVEVDGAPAQMLHLEGFGAARPIGTPLLVSPLGPKGFAVARSLGVPGVLTAGLPGSELSGDWEVCATIVGGTVLDEGEDATSRRVVEALGTHYATRMHGLWEHDADALSEVPGGAEWLARLEADRPPEERHLAVHAGHLCAVTERDRGLVEQAGALILEDEWTGDVAAVADRFDAAGKAGITEVVYMAMGPDIPDELARMADAHRHAAQRGA